MTFVIYMTIIFLAVACLIGYELYQEYQRQKRFEYEIKIMTDEIARLKEINERGRLNDKKM